MSGSVLLLRPRSVLGKRKNDAPGRFFSRLATSSFSPSSASDSQSGDDWRSLSSTDSEETASDESSSATSDAEEGSRLDVTHVTSRVPSSTGLSAKPRQRPRKYCQRYVHTGFCPCRSGENEYPRPTCSMVWPRAFGSDPNQREHWLHRPVAHWIDCSATEATAGPAACTTPGTKLQLYGHERPET